MQISTFGCPSDNNVPSQTITLNGVGRTDGYSSYPNNIGTYYYNTNQLDGPAYRLSANDPTLVTFATITDGLSGTAIWSEWVRGRLKDSSPGLHQTFKGSLPSAVPYNLDTLAADCQAATMYFGGAVATDVKGSNWTNHNCVLGGGYTHINTPNKKACFFSDETNNHTTFTMVGASSNHPGGVNVSFLDGSVKFIKESISPATWRAIATRDGGEVISADSL
jgi:prepilin-type processing-associated H-X9-DG protein